MNDLNRAGFDFRWLTDSTCIERLVDIFVAGQSRNYISHGEIQCGRAVAPDQWNPDISDVIRRELEQVLRDFQGGSENGVVVATNGVEIVGFAQVDIFRPDGVAPYAVINDMVIAEAVRGRGVGHSLIRWLEEDLAGRKICNVFLESGMHNEGAHRFFHREGFTQISISMMKTIGGKN